MNFKDIEDAVYAISDNAKIEYSEKTPLYFEDDEFYTKRDSYYMFMSIFIHMNEYKILICGVQFKDNKRINEAVLGIYGRDEENMNQKVFNIENVEFDPMMDNMKCHRRNLKKALKWIKENSVA